MDTHITYDEICMWSVDALKEFLRKRELKTSGKKAELIARVFAANEWSVPVLPTAKERDAIAEKEYAQLLQDIPDPKTLSGWKCERESTQDWPKIYLSDITMFLMRDHPGNDTSLARRVLNGYKEGKAYRLFEGGWLKELEFNNISPKHSYCYLRGKCTPSMKVNSVPHDMWLCAKKTGEIKSAYCSCTAGLGSMCIHITAMLFKAEAVIRSGVDKTACTSRPCMWNLPKRTPECMPMRLKDMKWKASVFNKVRSRSMVEPRKKLFQPLRPEFEEDENVKRQKLRDILRETIPTASFLSNFPKQYKSQNNIQVELHADDTHSVYLENFPVENNLIFNLASSVDTVSSFLKSIPEVSAGYVDCLERGTVGQSDNPHWITQRKYRITASNFYTVYTKINTVFKKQSTDQLPNLSNILDTVFTNKDISFLPSIKYGKATEPVARNVYMNLCTSKHVDFSSRECGLFIDQKLPYIGATPDLLLTCKCCGDGLLEIKCPYSIRDEEPSINNLGYLLNIEGRTCLSKHHPYYCQIQGQMAICNRNWCDFFVYTKHGHYMERIQFDSRYWGCILSNLKYFFENFVSPSLISGAYSRKNVDESELVALPPNVNP